MVQARADLGERLSGTPIAAPGLAARSAYLPEVDGLRACAAIAVVAYHMELLPIGWAGVWLFFVLSGFVITAMLLGGRWRLSAASYFSFTRRRAARIWPLYLLFAALGVTAEYAAGHGQDTLVTILTLLTFTYNFQAASENGFSVFHHLWTISVEQQFYLFYPFVFAAARHMGNVAPVAAVTAVSFLLRVAEFVLAPKAGLAPAEAGRILFYWSFGHFDAFGAGALVAFYAAAFRRPAVYRAVLCLAGALVLGIVGFDVATGDHARGMLYALAQPFIFPTKLPFHAAAPVTTYVAILAVSVVALATAIGPESWVRRAMRWPPLVRIGRISYGVYIWHMMVIVAVAWLCGSTIAAATPLLRGVLFLPCLAMSIGIAQISYRYYESRFHRRIGMPVEPVAGSAGRM